MSVGGGVEPLWSRDGRELFYRNGQRQMVAVRVETEGVFATGATSVLFSARDYRRDRVRRQHDVTATASGSSLIHPLGDRRESRLILVQNFIEELKRIAPK